MNSPPLHLFSARRTPPAARPRYQPVAPPELNAAKALCRLMGCELDQLVPGGVGPRTHGGTRARARVGATAAAASPPPDGGPPKRRHGLLRALRNLEPLVWRGLHRLMVATRALLAAPVR